MGTWDVGTFDNDIATIDRVLSGPSELLELWSDGDDFTRWRAALLDLRRRVAAG